MRTSSSHGWIFCWAAAASVFDGQPRIHALKVERGTLCFSAIEIWVGGEVSSQVFQNSAMAAIIFDSRSLCVICHCRAASGGCKNAR